MMLNITFMVSVVKMDCVEKLTVVGILPPTEWNDTNVSEVWILRQRFWEFGFMDKLILGIDAGIPDGTRRVIAKQVRIPLSLHLTDNDTNPYRRTSQGV
jgi:hypothetical protein